jgi:hypothetical protein
MTRALAFTLTNVLLFQVGWFVCILFASQWAVLYTLVAGCVHFYWSQTRVRDAIAVVLCLLIGVVHDSVLIHAGLIRFVESSLWPPLWLMCLWLLLGITLNHSLRWVYERPYWSAMLGAISGPLSYLAGVKLSSAEWSSPLTEVIPIIAFLWLLVLPLHRFLSVRITPYVQD